MPSPKRYKYRILYVGLDLMLTAFLKDELKPLDCYVVRCPSGRLSYCLIESEMPYIGGSEIKYSLFLFDEQLPDMTGIELAQFTRSIKQRATTPIVILSKDKARGMVAGLFFEKPYDVGSIIETIAARLQDSKT